MGREGEGQACTVSKVCYGERNGLGKEGMPAAKMCNVWREASVFFHFPTDEMRASFPFLLLVVVAGIGGKGGGVVAGR